MLARKIQDGLEISCFLCPSNITLETCSETKCNGRHFLTRDAGVMVKRWDDKMAWKVFLDGTIIELNANFESKKLVPKFLPFVSIKRNRFVCLDKGIPLVLVPHFGLGDKLCYWLCEHCSFKGVKDEDMRSYYIQWVVAQKYNIWKKYLNETQPQFLQKCAVEKRKATIANKKKAPVIRSEITTEMENAICHLPVPWEEIEKTEKIVRSLVERSKIRQQRR